MGLNVALCSLEVGSSAATTQQLPACIKKLFHISQKHRRYFVYRQYAAPFSKCVTARNRDAQLIQKPWSATNNVSPSQDMVLNTGVRVIAPQQGSELRTPNVCARALAAIAENTPQHTTIEQTPAPLFSEAVPRKTEPVSSALRRHI